MTALDDLADRDAIEEMVANGDLCSKDGRECDWVDETELYGADADGNRGIWQSYKRCSKCGEER